MQNELTERTQAVVGIHNDLHAHTQATTREDEQRAESGCERSITQTACLIVRSGDVLGVVPAEFGLVAQHVGASASRECRQRSVSDASGQPALTLQGGLHGRTHRSCAHGTKRVTNEIRVQWALLIKRERRIPEEDRQRAGVGVGRLLRHSHVEIQAVLHPNIRADVSTTARSGSQVQRNTILSKTQESNLVSEENLVRDVKLRANVLAQRRRAHGGPVGRRLRRL